MTRQAVDLSCQTIFSCMFSVLTWIVKRERHPTNQGLRTVSKVLLTELLMLSLLLPKITYIYISPAINKRYIIGINKIRL